MKYYRKYDINGAPYLRHSYKKEIILDIDRVSLMKFLRRLCSGKHEIFHNDAAGFTSCFGHL